MIRYDKKRKFVTTPFILTREEAERIDSSGNMEHCRSERDCETIYYIEDYTRAALAVAWRLADSGKFAKTSSPDLSDMIDREGFFRAYRGHVFDVYGDLLDSPEEAEKGGLK